MKKIFQILLALTLGTLLSNSVALAEETKTTAEFNDFGGKEGLTKLMDDFVYELLADESTKSFFVKADQKRLKEQLVNQFCEVLGGPCKYEGRSMKESHEGMGVKKHDFNGLVEALRRAMDKNKIPVRSQNKLLAKLAPMHKDIIEKK